MLIRGPAAATLGTECSHSRWNLPPVASRSPAPRRKDLERLLPVGGLDKLLEELVGPAHPAGSEVQPGPVVQLDAGHLREGGVDAGVCRPPQQRGLPRQGIVHASKVATAVSAGSATAFLEP